MGEQGQAGFRYATPEEASEQINRDFNKRENPNGCNMNFGDALAALRRGERVARSGWNGKGMFVFLVGGSEFTVSRAPLSDHYPMGTPITYRAHLDMRYVDGSIGVWLASQSDILATDWYPVVEADGPRRKQQ